MSTNKYLSDKNFDKENQWYKKAHTDIGHGVPCGDIDLSEYNIINTGGKFLPASQLTTDNIEMRALTSYSPFSELAQMQNFIAKIEEKKLSMLYYKKIADAINVPVYHIFFNQRGRWPVFEIKEKNAVPVYLNEFNDEGYAKFIRWLHR